MSRQRFGFFGGVFTPGILTILGVIMYMRLPWIIGNAGLLYTLAIIAAAHIVSVTTGLSVSSVATDKRVEAGGTYFMISRSLGLPIGGTLGLALFVGLSFSVSLYLIGFSESFLGYLGIEATRNNIRICGAATLLVVTTVTFISTALAIKTQYYIMAAIAASLVSIFFGDGYVAPDNIAMEPTEGGAPLALLFGIFFPAVTGFEAGVSMSGDLKNPRRDIPRGTLLAIGVGFVVYVVLAAFLAARVPQEQLLNNPQVLLEAAWWSAPVLAGIWGATISSALGSILGAPRILQAVATDRIAPRVFSRGVGPSNEPRNALLLTFVIALSGILIGELDAIARIVSVFFLSAYCVLNLSCFVESWVSPDFRPEFRIPRWVSLLGAVTCLILMIQLDLAAMIAAFLVMGAMFVAFRRRQLALETGDAWGGVWSSLVRLGLERLHRTRGHQRNWRPNVLLFTGDGDSSGPLRQITRSLAHQRGVVTEFVLDTGRHSGPKSAEPKSAEPKSAEPNSVEPSAPEDEPHTPGLFRRVVQTDDPLGTVLAASAFHGMTGFEPNTVVLDYDTLGAQSDRAGGVLGTLGKRGFHTVVFVSSPRATPAESARIDVWAHGPGRNLGLSLALLRFLTSDNTWRRVPVRFLAVAADPAHRRSLERRIAIWLAGARVEAEVRVLEPNPSDATPEAPILRASADAELVFVGLPDDGAFEVAKRLRDLPGGVMAIHASTGFAAPIDGLEPAERLRAVAPVGVAKRSDVAAAPEAPASDTALTSRDGANPAVPGNPVVSQIAEDADRASRTAVDDFLVSLDRNVGRIPRELLRSLAATLKKSLRRAAAASSEANPKRRERLAARLRADFRRATGSQLSAALRDIASNDADRTALLECLGPLASALQAVEDAIPETLELERPTGGDFPKPGLFDRLRGRTETVVIPLQGYVRWLHERQLVAAVTDTLRHRAAHRHRRLTELEGLQDWAQSAIDRIGRDLAAGTVQREVIDGLIEEIEARATVLGAAIAEQRTVEVNSWRSVLDELALGVADVLVNPLHPHAQRTSSRSGTPPVDSAGLTDQFAEQLSLHRHTLGRLGLENSLHEVRDRARQASTRFRRELGAALDSGVIRPLQRLAESIGADTPAAHEPVHVDLRLAHDALIEELITRVGRIAEQLPDEVEVIDSHGVEALNDASDDPPEPATIEVRRLVRFVLETEQLGPVRHKVANLGQAVAMASNTARDVVRLITFSTGQAFDADVDGTERAELIASGQSRLERERESLKRQWDEVQSALDQLLVRVDTLCRVEGILSSANELSRFMGTLERQRLFSRFGEFGRRIQERGRRAAIDVAYGWTRGVVVARGRLEDRPRALSRVEAALDLVQASTPSREVEAALPVFYREVFLGHSANDPAYWTDQDRQMARIRTTVERHQAGHPGALLITGPPGSGASALGRRVSSQFFAGKTITVTPPPEGTTDPERFQTLLVSAIGVQASVDQALQTLPPRSAVLLPEIEGWWERSPDGLGVIDTLEALIERHGAHVFFVLTGNSYAVRHLTRLGRLSDRVLCTIYQEAFDAAHLRETIMRRHRTTGLQLRIEGDPIAGPTEWGLTRIFTGLFEATGGYVGSAMHAWIGHIVDVSNRHVVLRRPAAADLTGLENLGVDDIALLVELLMHRRIGLERLLRVTERDEAELVATLNALERSGLIKRVPGYGAYRINGFVTHHLNRWLREEGVL